MCNYQTVLNALAVLIAAVAPGVAALLVALSNRATINRLPVKRATDVAARNGGESAGNTTS